MPTLPMALPFVALVLAALIAMLGFRWTAIWVSLVATVGMVAVFLTHLTTPLQIAL